MRLLKALLELENMKKGKVIFFNAKSKFGFIRENETKTEYYFSIKNPDELFKADDEVEFETQLLKRGEAAIKVKKVE